MRNTASLWGQLLAFGALSAAAAAMPAQEREQAEDKPARQARPQSELPEAARQPSEEKKEIFSGPQVGEALRPFEVRSVVGRDAGKKTDLVTRAEKKPLVLFFLHEFDRPTLQLTNAIMKYAAERAQDGLTSGVVLLAEDATEAEARLKRAQHALQKEIQWAVSLDGAEGPGPYGLNRNVAVTVLVGKENKVTANFAIVQASAQADAPKILKAIVDVLGGGKVPTLAELGLPRYRQEVGAADEALLRRLLGPVINKSASEEQVAAAAKRLEDEATRNDWLRREVGLRARRIKDAGRLESYGTPAAQKYLAKWAGEFQP